MSRIYIAYDSGASAVKAISFTAGEGKGKKIRFAALVDLVTATTLDLPSKDSKYIRLPEDDGAYNPYIAYEVGKVNARFDISNTRYTDKNELVRFYAALSQLLPKTNSTLEINLCVGANVKAYLHQKKEIERFFMNGGKPHVFQAGNSMIDRGQHYSVVIKKLLVEPQPFGAITKISKALDKSISINDAQKKLLERAPLQTATICGIDIGMFTTDIWIVKGNVPLQDKCTSFDVAVSTFHEKVEQLIASMRRSFSPSTEDIEQAITTGSAIVLRGKGEDTVDISREIAQLRAGAWDKIVSEITRYLGETKANYIFVGGGGARVFREEIKARWGKHAGFVVPSDPEWAIAEGFLNKLVEVENA